MIRPLYKYIISQINENGQKNFFLQAPGGAGKTYQMLALRDDCLDSKDTVSGRILLPLFVDVKHLSEVEDTPLFSGLIKYFGNDITDGKTILSFFKKGAESEKYAYLIIVDGLNECNAVLREKIFDNLVSIEVNNTYIVVSSRADENKYANFETTPNEKAFLDSCQALTLKSLSVDEYLLGKGIDKGLYDGTLLNVIQIPFYMSKFIETINSNAVAFQNKSVRAGDILYEYIKTLLSVVDKKENKQSTGTKQEQRFVIEYYLPALAFYMATNEKMSISSSDFRKLRRFLSVDFFTTLLNKEFEDNVQIEDHYKNTIIPNAKNHIVDLLLNQVALVELTSTDQDNNFSFQHQILRDMLAAVHIINVIRYSNNYSELEITVDDNILLFVGELFKDKNGLSECDFKKFYEENNKQLKPPIEDFLREKREKLKKHPVAIRNIVEIIKISREYTLDNIDLSNLNLSMCSFINVSLKSANLSNTTISNNTFSTLELSFLPKILYADSKIIVGEVIEYLKSETTIVGFSTKTGHIVYSLTICKKHNCKISFINNKNIVCVVQGDETSVVVRDLYTGEIIKRFHVNDIISSQDNENVVIQCAHIHDTQNLVVLAYNNSINKEILTIYNINSGATSEHCAPFEKNSLTTEKKQLFLYDNKCLIEQNRIKIYEVLLNDDIITASNYYEIFVENKDALGIFLYHPERIMRIGRYLVFSGLAFIAFDTLNKVAPQQFEWGLFNLSSYDYNKPYLITNIHNNDGKDNNYDTATEYYYEKYDFSSKKIKSIESINCGSAKFKEYSFFNDLVLKEYEDHIDAYIEKKEISRISVNRVPAKRKSKLYCVSDGIIAIKTKHDNFILYDIELKKRLNNAKEEKYLKWHNYLDSAVATIWNNKCRISFDSVLSKTYDIFDNETIKHQIPSSLIANNKNDIIAFYDSEQKKKLFIVDSNNDTIEVIENEEFEKSFDRIVFASKNTIVMRSAILDKEDDNVFRALLSINYYYTTYNIKTKMVCSFDVPAGIPAYEPIGIINNYSDTYLVLTKALSLTGFCTNGKFGLAFVNLDNGKIVELKINTGTESTITSIKVFNDNSLLIMYDYGEIDTIVFPLNMFELLEKGEQDCYEIKRTIAVLSNTDLRDACLDDSKTIDEDNEYIDLIKWNT